MANPVVSILTQVIDGQTKYFLTAKTTLQNTKYQNNGEEPFSGQQNPEGNYELILRISEDPNQDQNRLNIVSHTAMLDQVNGSEAPIPLEVKVLNISQNNQELAKVVVTDDDPDGDGRPGFGQ